MAPSSNTTYSRERPDINANIRQFLSDLKAEHGFIKNELLRDLVNCGLTEDEAKKLYDFVEKFKHLLPEDKKYNPNSTIRKLVEMMTLLFTAKPELQKSLFGGLYEATPLKTVKETSKQQGQTSNMSHPGISGRKIEIKINTFVNKMHPSLNILTRCHAAMLATEKRFDFLREKDPRQYTVHDLTYISKYFSELRVIFEDIFYFAPAIDNTITANPAFNHLNKILQKSFKSDFLRGIPVTAAGISNNNYLIPLGVFFLQASIFLSHVSFLIIRKLLLELERTIFTDSGTKKFKYEILCENVKKEEFFKYIDLTETYSSKLLSNIVFNAFYEPFKGKQDTAEWSNLLYIQCNQRAAVSIKMLELFKPYTSLDSAVVSTEQEAYVVENFIVPTEFYKLLQKLNALNFEILKDKAEDFKALDDAMKRPLFYLKKNWDLTNDLSQTNYRVMQGAITEEDIARKYNLRQNAQ